MPTDCLRNTRKKTTCFAQVSEVEKQLCARIHSHGVLDTGVKSLYKKACSIYEKLFLSDNDLQELQNIEYLLWRLHYKHIDEFRKTNNNPTTHDEGFLLFLSEASKYYQDLIRSIKRYNCLFDEPWFYKNDGVSGRIEQMKLLKCQFVCHRLCICLGDLARYVELYEKPSHDQRNWAVAAGFYLEAAKIYPDGGNPQNQLAVLATYIGEEFLALYHCIRSLAVKEPFPDALQNLMLLFERNRSNNIVSLTNEMYDFSKPSVWLFNNCKEFENGIITCKEAPNDFWSLFIRMASFFFLESSLEDFNCTFASTLREFEALLTLDVVKLTSALQSYQNMSLLKAGPYRALHIIAILLFVIHNLSVNKKPTNDKKHAQFVSLALTTTFTFMVRIVDRCLKGSPVIYFPLLPALLVFVEWLLGAIPKHDSLDEKCEKAISYFFGSTVKLLNHLQENTPKIIDPSCNVALWEDYELRGFIPLSPTHELLDFSSHWEDEINYRMKNEYRSHRIIQAAIKISRKCRDSTRNWLFYDKEEKIFRSDSEEEDIIVFKPLARYNSEPLTLKDGKILESSNEFLRRASSLLVAQNRALIDSFTSPSQAEYIPKESKSNQVPESVIAAGAPSLSSWVISEDIAKNSGIERTVLKSIPENIPDESSTPLLNPNAGLQSGLTHVTSGFRVLDHWSHNDPLDSLPGFCIEGRPPLFSPSPSLLHGLNEQRRDIRVSDVRLEPHSLL